MPRNMQSRIRIIKVAGHGIANLRLEIFQGFRLGVDANANPGSAVAAFVSFRDFKGNLLHQGKRMAPRRP